VKCLQYVNNKFIKGGPEVFTKEVEELIIKEIKKLLQVCLPFWSLDQLSYESLHLQDVSADEFQQCMQILSQTKLGKTITGHQELVKLCIEQADLEADLESDTASDDDVVFCFLQCTGEALPYFSSQIEATPFVKFTCDKFFPLSTWHLIGAADDQPQTQLRLLKVFAELCSHCGTLEKAKDKVEAIFNVLLEFLPAPPTDVDITDAPSIHFSHVECLLYAIHALGKQCPEYLTFPENPEKLKDFRARLQYLARGTQG
jgi:Apoptosis inhibitory protein 5 (API5)